ncbi:hypothetical protein DRO27_04010, partial [Candidatus Bathyarchaeota archaeon]
MREKEFREYLRTREQGEAQIEKAVEAVRDFEGELGDKTVESATLDDLRGYVALLVSRRENSLDRLVALSRYFYATDRNDLYIYFTAVLGGRTVLPSISERLESLVDEETMK